MNGILSFLEHKQCLFSILQEFVQSNKLYDILYIYFWCTYDVGT